MPSMRPRVVAQPEPARRQTKTTVIAARRKDDEPQRTRRSQREFRYLSVVDTRGIEIDRFDAGFPGGSRMRTEKLLNTETGKNGTTEGSSDVANHTTHKIRGGFRPSSL